jgi:hypothetical protein
MMKYKILARVIRAFLLLGIVGCFISTILNIGNEFFNMPRYIKIGRYTIGDTRPGYLLSMSLQLSIPDTAIIYKTAGGGGEITSSADMLAGPTFAYDPKAVTQKVIHRLRDYEKTSPVKISNHLTLMNGVQVSVDSSNKAHRLFWCFYTQLKFFFWVLIFYFLIKLINAYLKGNFLTSRNFRFISYIGMLLIVNEVFEFVCLFINAKIIPGIHLEKETLVGPNVKDFINVNLNFGNSVSYSNIGIGIMVILLSKIIKEAVLIKQENDLTI